MINPIRKIVDDNKAGLGKGCFSVCTANPLAIRASMRSAIKSAYPLIIESTANQVNHLGGYTGMQPADFVKLIYDLAAQENFPRERIVLGGDHLGPLVWQALPEDEAMSLAEETVAAYAAAGYGKIHIDTSMRLGSDDQNAPLPVSLCAARGARLAKRMYAALPKDAPKPALVIGSEVPIPGGSQEHEDSITPTNPDDFRHQVELFQKAFAKEGVTFDDVTAFVVQPGVEFGDDFVFQYNPERAKKLMAALRDYPSLAFEGHSSDYQTRESLRKLVLDGVAILKVGPAFTFSVRENLFLMDEIAQTLGLWSGFKSILFDTMRSDDRYWKKYYTGTRNEVDFKLLYSFSDRCRYYMPYPAVSDACDKLLSSLDETEIPPALLSQYFPRQFARVMEGSLQPKATDVLLDRVCDWISDYEYACGWLD